MRINLNCLLTDVDLGQRMSLNGEIAAEGLIKKLLLPQQSIKNTKLSKLQRRHYILFQL